jgi:hypothetical protein
MSSRALVLAACVALLVPPAAHADGDPASDYLIGQSVFVPFGGQVTTADASRVTALVADAAKKGFTIRVAVIASPTDLGSVTALWRKPQRYAQFLGQELYFVYKGRLLIVMPNGYGISSRGKPVPDERKVLDALPLPTKDLAAATTTAIRRLAAAKGVEVAAPSSGGSSENRDRAIIAAVAIAVAIVAGLAALLRRRRGARYS